MSADHHDDNVSIDESTNSDASDLTSSSLVTGEGGLAESLEHLAELARKLARAAQRAVRQLDGDPAAATRARARKGVRKAPGAPKRPGNAYTLFVQDNRAKYAADDLSNQDVMKRVAAAWKLLPAGEREPYERRAIRNQTDYRQKVLEFKASRNSRAGEVLGVRGPMSSSSSSSSALTGGEGLVVGGSVPSMAIGGGHGDATSTAPMANIATALTQMSAGSIEPMQHLHALLNTSGGGLHISSSGVTAAPLLGAVAAATAASGGDDRRRKHHKKDKKEKKDKKDRGDDSD